MIVVSDTSPLNYLVLVGAVDVLEKLYERVVIPGAVDAELSRPDTPEPVRRWMAQRPAWIEVHAVPLPDLSLPVDRGEQEAITLARQIRADGILLDERRGRAVAIAQGLNVTGTLSVLDAAGANGLLEVPAVLNRLQQTTFRADAALLEELLRRDRERKDRA